MNLLPEADGRNGAYDKRSYAFSLFFFCSSLYC
jgi:hypothetical protein